jgi:hypothetical protein
MLTDRFLMRLATEYCASKGLAPPRFDLPERTHNQQQQQQHTSSSSSSSSSPHSSPHSSSESRQESRQESRSEARSEARQEARQRAAESEEIADVLGKVTARRDRISGLVTAIPRTSTQGSLADTARAEGEVREDLLRCLAANGKDPLSCSTYSDRLKETALSGKARLAQFFEQSK